MTHMKENPLARHRGLRACAVTAQAAEPAAKPTPTDLEAVFRKPPEGRIRTYAWHWINGHITKAGITADLEDMAKAGFAGAIIYHGGNRPADIGERKATEDQQKFIRRTGTAPPARAVYSGIGPRSRISGQRPSGPASPCSGRGAPARVDARHACQRGWSGSGGPWIKDKHAYKNIHSLKSRLKAARFSPDGGPSRKTIPNQARDSSALSPIGRLRRRWRRATGNDCRDRR